ncbi:MAG: hypothetical protein Q9227_002747 [Pyrenula ochraceoflavens]
MNVIPPQGEGMKAYRAPSLFQPHRARQALRDAHEGKIPPLVGFYFGLSSVPLARHIAPFGFDAAWVDWEHSSCNVETMTEMVHSLMFCSEGRTMPFVRIPGHDHAAVGYALDCGASIVVPQVDTVEQAKHVVSAAKFGTKYNGSRSAPPFRLIPGLTDQAIDDKMVGGIHENLNHQAAIMIQIESLEGIRNLDAILTEVPDIDAVWLGTLDAKVSMNLPSNGGMGGNEPEWVEAVELYEKTMAKHDKPKAGFAMGPPEMMRMMGKGKSFVVTCADVLSFMSLGGDLKGAHDVFPAEPLGVNAASKKSVPTKQMNNGPVAVDGEQVKHEEKVLIAANGSAPRPE